MAGGVRDADDQFSLLSSEERAQVRLLPYSLADQAVLERVIETVLPDAIFHLAAQSFVPASLKDPVATWEVNALGTQRLLDAVRAVRDRVPGFAPVIVQAASAEVYGKASPNAMPLAETAPHRPANPYAASKVAQLAIGYQAHATWGLKVISATAFNHIGPGQTDAFVVSSFARQLAEIAVGNQPPILSVGNLEARRDFTDVRDVVRAYALLAEQGQPGETYNVCSGTSIAIREVLDRLVAVSGQRVEVKPDPARMRPSDVPELYGTHGKLSLATGWRREIPLDQTLSDTYTHWLNTLGAKAPVMELT